MQSREIPQWVRRLPPRRRLVELLYLRGLEGGQDPRESLAAAARRVCVPFSTASRWHDEVPTSSDREGQPGAEPAADTSPATWEALNDAIAEAERAAGANRAEPTRADEVEHGLSLAQRHLSDGSIDLAARVVRERALNVQAVSRRLRRRHYEALVLRVAVLNADLLMQRNETGSALRIAGRVGHRAERIDPAAAVTLYTIAGAACRMHDFKLMADAHRWFQRAVEILEAGHVPPAVRPGLARWIYAAMSSPLTLMGKTTAAQNALSHSADLLTSSDPAGQAETHLYQARLALASGARERASELVSMVAESHSELPLWVRGWLPRYQLDVLLGSAPRPDFVMGERLWTPALELLATAWRRTDGFGFQRMLLLARLASISAPAPVEAASLGVAVFGQMKYAVRELHRRQHGTWIGECSTCRRVKSLGAKARHALHLQDARDWRFLN